VVCNTTSDIMEMMGYMSPLSMLTLVVAGGDSSSGSSGVDTNIVHIMLTLVMSYEMWSQES